MNFRELRNRLISSLWDYIGCPVILSNQVQPEAEPPFCIYTVTAPYIPDGGMGDYEIADVAEGVKISRLEMPSATFSFTFCSQNRTAENGSAVNGEDEAWAVADKAISYFKHAGQDDFLALGVAVVDVGQAQDRTTLLGGVAFVLCSFGANAYYRVPWLVWCDMKNLFGRKYVTQDDLKAYRVRFAAPGVLLFLEGMNNEKH